LKVTDNTHLSFPSSGLPDLSSTASSQVLVKASCNCINDLTALAKSKLVQLTWTNTYADHYNIYRSTVSGGPYTLIATVPGSAMTRLGFLDKTVTNNTTYYYVVRDANLNGDEYCQSNEVKAKPVSLI
jgi:fibronectin type 3 domain-containing protein